MGWLPHVCRLVQAGNRTEAPGDGRETAGPAGGSKGYMAAIHLLCRDERKSTLSQRRLCMREAPLAGAPSQRVRRFPASAGKGRSRPSCLLGLRAPSQSPGASGRHGASGAWHQVHYGTRANTSVKSISCLLLEERDACPKTCPSRARGQGSLEVHCGRPPSKHGHLNRLLAGVRMLFRRFNVP